MAAIILDQPKFGCNRARISGVYVTQIPVPNSGSPIEAEVYIRLAYLDDDGAILPGEYGVKLSGLERDAFFAQFLNQEAGALAFLQAVGAVQGVLEP